MDCGCFSSDKLISIGNIRLTITDINHHHQHQCFSKELSCQSTDCELNISQFVRRGILGILSPSQQSPSPSAKKNMQIWKFPPPSHPVLGILVSKCNAFFSLVNLLRPQWAVHSVAFCSSRFLGTRPKVNLWGGAFFEFYPPGCARNSTVLRKWIIQIWNLIPGLYQRSLLLLSLNVFVCALSIQ